MKTSPVKQIDLDQAIKFQFRLMDIVQTVFRGRELLEAGDYGVSLELGRPKATAKVERVIADFFQADDAALVRGAGSGAMRLIMNSVLQHGRTLLIHDAPMYPTTKNIVEQMAVNVVRANMNDAVCLREGLNQDIDAVLVQHSRQKPDDHYDMGEVIAGIKSVRSVPIITDENYVAMKASRIGVQLGADASAFSLFKLLGPEGIGCAVGKQEIINQIHKLNYSGGSQVQGPEAMEALRALVYTPVSLALQARQVDEIVDRLNSNEVSGVKKAYVANAQSRVVLVEFAEPIAQQVLQFAEELGAVPYPVGSESKYEIGAMFYRISGTFTEERPELLQRMIRVNPMRSGADTVIRILQESVRKALV